MTATDRSLETWFAEQAARERRAVRLEDALLGDRFAPYFAYRLRWFGARYVVATVVQLVKVLVVHRLLGVSGFVAVVGLVAISGLVAGGWWGALEVLRARVRQLYQFSAPTTVGREIARWVIAGARIGLALGFVAVAWLLIRSVAGRGLEPVDLAIGAVLLRTGLDLPVRAYHSGAFALRRVYRPWASMLALDVLGLGLLIALVPLIGAWSIGVSELAMAVGFAMISLWYAARTHRLLGLAPERLVSIGTVFGRRRTRGRPGRAGRRGSSGGRTGHRLRVPALAAVREIAVPAGAGVAVALDSLVVLAVISAATLANEPWLAVLIAGISPTVRAGFDWSQLVYFDLKRLDAPLFVNLRRRLDRATVVLALVLGAGFSVVAVVIAVAFLGVAEASLVWLPPFLIAASVLGLSQMQAFTTAAYPRVMLGGVVLLVGLLGIRPLAEAGIDPLFVLAAATTAAAMTVRVARRRGVAGGSAPEPVIPTAWLTSLVTHSGPIRVGVVRVRAAERKSGNGTLADPVVLREWRAMQLGRGLARRVGRRGAVTLVDTDRVAWFTPDDSRPAITRRSVVLEANGRITELFEARSTGVAEAIAQLGAWRVFPSTAESAESAEAAAPATDIEIERSFRSIVPRGIVFAPDQAAASQLATMPATERRLVLWDAIRHARMLSVRPGRGPNDVTAWCPDGTLRLVFIAPRSVGDRAKGRWRAQLRAANLAAASGGRLPACAAAASPLTREGIVEASTREPAPPVLAAPAATEFRLG